MEGVAQAGNGGVQGGLIGLSPATSPKIAPNGLRAGVPANPSVSEATDSSAPTDTVSSGATASANSQTKMSGIKKALALSLLYKYGYGIDKRSEGVMSKVKVTASPGVPDKTKNQVSASLSKTMPGYKPVTKEGQLLVKLAAMAGTQGVSALVKKGDSAKTAARKIATVIKLKRAFKRIGF